MCKAGLTLRLTTVFSQHSVGTLHGAAFDKHANWQYCPSTCFTPGTNAGQQQTQQGNSGFSSGRPWATGALPFAVFGFADPAEARMDVVFSVGAGLPGVQVGASNLYPVCAQPQSVCVQPKLLCTQLVPVYAPRPAYYGLPACCAAAVARLRRPATTSAPPWRLLPPAWSQTG